MVAGQHDRFDRWDNVELDRIARLPVEPGPWCNEQWLIRDAAGDNRRGSRGVCACPDCGHDVYWLGGNPDEGGDGVGLCYGHYFRWWRGGRAPIREWLAREGQRPLGRTRGRPTPGPVNFTELPASVAHEIRFVVGRKISRGDWTPNRSLRKFLKTLIHAAKGRVDDSLLERQPDQWLLLTRQFGHPSAVSTMYARPMCEASSGSSKAPPTPTHRLTTAGPGVTVSSSHCSPMTRQARTRARRWIGPASRCLGCAKPCRTLRRSNWSPRPQRGTPSEHGFAPRACSANTLSGTMCPHRSPSTGRYFLSTSRGSAALAAAAHLDR